MTLSGGGFPWGTPTPLPTLETLCSWLQNLGENKALYGQQRRPKEAMPELGSPRLYRDIMDEHRGGAGGEPHPAALGFIGLLLFWFIFNWKMDSGPAGG